MNKGIIIYLSIIMGFCLTIGGAYFTINNIIEPKGLLFEGIISMGLGLTILMILKFATVVGKSFTIFGEIMEQTTELNKQISKSNNLSSKIPNLFKGDIPPGSSMTITDLDSGKIENMNLSGNSIDAIKLMNEMINNVVGKHKEEKNNLTLNELSDSELEKRLAKSVNTDDFETAAEINKILKDRRELGNNSEGKNHE